MNNPFLITHETVRYVILSAWLSQHPCIVVEGMSE